MVQATLHLLLHIVLPAAAARVPVILHTPLMSGSNAISGITIIGALILAGAIAFGGTLFSIYLTFLEPFVIGATCMWCLTSAVAITGLLWSTAGPAWSAFGRLRSS